MSYITEISGGLGKIFQPSPRTRSLIAVGILKPGANAAMTRWNIITNGDFVLQDAHEARYTAYVAKSTIPVITKFREDPTSKYPKTNVYREWIAKFLATPADTRLWDDPESHGSFWKILAFHDGKTGQEEKLKDILPLDILARTWPMYHGHGFMYFQDSEYDTLLTEEYELHEVFDHIQQLISEFLTLTKYPLTEWTPLGFGEVEFHADKAPKLEKRPGRETRFLEKYKMRMDFPSLTNNLPDMAYYYFWLELLAQALKWIIVIDGYTDDDYLALAWHIIYQANGAGTNTRPTEYPLNADDIFGQILDNIGDDSNEAYTYRFANPAEWRLYLGYCIIKALVISRIDAEIHDVDFHLTEGDRLTAVESLRRIWHSDYDDFGSETTPFYVPATTYLEDDCWLPCIINMHSDNDVNVWSRLSPIVGDKFQKVKVEKHEILSSVLEPLDTTTAYIEWDLSTNDARRQEILYRRHKVILFKFQLHGYTDRLFGERGRLQQFFMAQITGTPIHWKHGYVMKPGLNIVVDPGIVNVFPTIAATGLVVQKEHTQASGPQMEAPGAITGANNAPVVNPPSAEEHKNMQPAAPPDNEVKLIPGQAKEAGAGDKHLEHHEPEHAEDKK